MIIIDDINKYIKHVCSMECYLNTHTIHDNNVMVTMNIGNALRVWVVQGDGEVVSLVAVGAAYSILKLD